jgi:hypothetical protein
VGTEYLGVGENVQWVEKGRTLDGKDIMCGEKEQWGGNR